jgi:hypothetical protein
MSPNPQKYTFQGHLKEHSGTEIISLKQPSVLN